MLFDRFQRRTAWLVLSSYLLAGIAAESIHEHGAHGAAKHFGETEHHLPSHAAASDAATGLAPVADIAASVAASANANAQTSTEDGCAICRFLGQVRLATPVAPQTSVCRLVTTLLCDTPSSATSDFSAAPYSRGPPQLI